MLDYDRHVLNALSGHNQNSIMIACSFNNGPVLKFVVDNTSNLDHSLLDNWGFSAITYCIKNNFLAGLVFLISRGATLDQRLVDSNKCTMAHWAAFMDRKLILGMLFRSDHDFLQKDQASMAAWDRAVDNWSLFAINFILDYTNRPLKTLYFLKGKTNFPEIDLIPETTKVKSYEIESIYIRDKLNIINRIRKGHFKSLGSMFKESYGVHLISYIKYRWYKSNIPSNYWIKCYIALTILFVLHYAFLGVLASGQESPSSQGQQPAMFSTSFILLFGLLAVSNLLNTIFFGKTLTHTRHQANPEETLH